MPHRRGRVPSWRRGTPGCRHGRERALEFVGSDLAPAEHVVEHEDGVGQGHPVDDVGDRPRRDVAAIPPRCTTSVVASIPACRTTPDRRGSSSSPGSTTCNRQSQVPSSGRPQRAPADRCETTAGAGARWREPARPGDVGRARRGTTHSLRSTAAAVEETDRIIEVGGPPSDHRRERGGHGEQLGDTAAPDGGRCSQLWSASRPALVCRTPRDAPVNARRPRRVETVPDSAASRRVGGVSASGGRPGRGVSLGSSGPRRPS